MSIMQLRNNKFLEHIKSYDTELNYCNKKSFNKT